MQLFKNIILLLIFLKFITIFSINNNKILNPTVSLVLVIDQFGINYIYKLNKFLNSGLKFLVNNGVFYKNAFHEHAPTVTAAGHVAISTGTFANYHGVIANEWYNSQGQRIEFGQDDSINSLVFAKNNFYNFGISPKHIMVDTLSDQLVLNSNYYKNYQVWGLSSKPRAAVAMAGHLGKALWFDEITGTFTSSRAYFKKLPEWVKDFNLKQNLHKLKDFSWDQLFKDQKYYNFPYIKNYKYADNKSIININNIINLSFSKPFNLFDRTPQASNLLIELSKSCISQFKNKANKANNNDNLVLYISLSNLDKVGHDYGPYSKEAIDTVYWLDKQIGDLINYTYKNFNSKEVFITLTADHGVIPIVELLNNQGFSLAKKLNLEKIKKDLNNKINSKFKIKDLIANYIYYQFYLNLNKLPKNKKLKKKIFSFIKKELKKIPGIRNSWTFKELVKTNFDKTFNLDNYIKRQLYKPRNGQIFYSIEPYTYMSGYGFKGGTGHGSPYNYDAHVPLILYQKGQFEKKSVAKKVAIEQFAPTFAYILDMPRPSASKLEVLPELF